MYSPSLFRRGLALVVAFALLVAPLGGTPPVWWTTQNVLVPGATANDYAAVNLGQLKQIAYGAFNEMQAKLPGGAGSTLSTLIGTWTQPPASGVTRNDYAAVNLGQLKAVAKPFYDRLAQLTYSGPPLTAGQAYPWSGSTNAANDYAMANIGQLKFVFSFVIGSVPGDSDGNGLVDAWETANFGHIGVDPNADPDLDGLRNIDEFLLGTNPNKVGDGTMPGGSVTFQVVLAIPGGTYLGVKSDWSVAPVGAP